MQPFPHLCECWLFPRVETGQGNGAVHQPMFCWFCWHQCVFVRHLIRPLFTFWDQAVFSVQLSSLVSGRVWQKSFLWYEIRATILHTNHQSQILNIWQPKGIKLMILGQFNALLVNHRSWHSFWEIMQCLCRINFAVESASLSLYF